MTAHLTIFKTVVPNGVSPYARSEEDTNNWNSKISNGDILSTQELSESKENSTIFYRITVWKNENAYINWKSSLNTSERTTYNSQNGIDNSGGLDIPL